MKPLPRHTFQRNSKFRFKVISMFMYKMILGYIVTFIPLAFRINLSEGSEASFADCMHYMDI